MKQIVIFSAFYDPFMSGAERMVKEVVERLQDRYSFIIITARLANRSQKSEVRSKNYIVRRIGFGNKFDKFLYPILAPFYALKYQPVIAHAVMESYAGIALLFYQYLRKIFCIPNPAFYILTLQSGDLDLSEKQARIPHALWKRIHTASNLVISIGNSMARRARKLGAKNVIVIPNGVDLAAANKTTVKNLQKISHRVICVARLSQEKGIEYLIDAMPKILTYAPDAGLVLVGDGLFKHKLELRIANYELEIRSKIFLLGNLSHERTLEEIAKSEVLVLPSLAEGMGIVLVEAQALGVPVIGTNVGGIPDVIEHEKTGLLVPPANADAIADAAKKTFSLKDLAVQMTEEAKKRLQKFDWQNIAEQYATIYESGIPAPE